MKSRVLFREFSFNTRMVAMVCPFVFFLVGICNGLLYSEKVAASWFMKFVVVLNCVMGGMIIGALALFVFITFRRPLRRMISVAGYDDVKISGDSYGLTGCSQVKDNVKSPLINEVCIPGMVVEVEEVNDDISRLHLHTNYRQLINELLLKLSDQRN